MSLVDRIDAVVVALAADMARRSEGVDRIIVHIQGLSLFKGGVLLALIAWVWFAATPERSRNRAIVLKTLAAGLLAAAASRTIQNVASPRGRPMNSASEFVPPYGITPEVIAEMTSWSSFPSDHAALFFALAAGLWVIHRRLGAAAILWTTVVISLPRLYLGLHYASDIIGGAVIGIVVALILFRLPDRLFEPAWRIERSHPGPFYAVAFLFCFELANLFWDVRSTIIQVIESAGLIIGA